MDKKSSLKADHAPTLPAAFLYFDLALMVWVILGPLGVQIAADLGLSHAQKGMMVATPVLAGAILRMAMGLLVDHLKPKLTGAIGQVIVMAALFGPGLAAAYGWTNVFGMALIPLAAVFAFYVIVAKDAPEYPPPKRLAEYLTVLRDQDAWWFMFFYSVTFGGFVGLASSLTIYFNIQYGLDPKMAGYFAAACVFGGSLVRPLGGALADRVGGITSLSVVYMAAAAFLAIVSLGLPEAWMALGMFVLAMLALGMGNGAVFQLVPQRFCKEIGVMTGLVGMAGGVGGFYLASSLGYSKQMTGSYMSGFLIFAALAMLALTGLSAVKTRWRTTWGAPHLTAARI